MADALALFDPLVADWFATEVGAPSPVQVAAWPVIAGGEHVLATAPTGSGKTLAACLWALDRLLTGAWDGGGIRVVYVSPLKALGSDVQRNLKEPLAALRQRFADAGRAAAPVRVGLRSGDTTATERERQRRQPPEILVTTPESFNLLLASSRWRDHFTGVRLLIIDEVHAVLDSKRGVWLLHAIEECTRRAAEPQRVTLSATVRPLDRVAACVGGFHLVDGTWRPRPVRQIVAGERALPELTIEAIEEIDQAQRAEDPERFWQQTAPRLRAAIRQARSTLIFCNSRRLCEKLARFINAGAEERLAWAHHGSLSREMRQAVEARLKEGRVRCVVCTGTLELGIDIGDCDQVLLVQSPPRVASLLQRLGRAGHRLQGVSRGRLFATHGVDLLEAVVLRRQALAGAVEPTRPVRAPLDVLSQIILARCLVGPQPPERLWQELQAEWAYRSLSRDAFDLVVELLCGRHAGGPLREARPLLARDPDDGRLRALDAARPVFSANAGTIVDRGYFQLRRAGDQAQIGELDEEFVWERRVGDRFLFGSRAWRIERIGVDSVEVAPVDQAQVMAPFWRAEEQDRDWPTAAAIGEFLHAVGDRIAGDAAAAELADELVRDAGCTPAAAEQLIDTLRRQAAVTDGLPHRRRVVIERSRMPGGGGEFAILHASWGRRLLRPYGLALQSAWRRRYDSELGVEAADACLLLQLPHPVSEAELRALVLPDDPLPLVREGLEHSGFFGARFRECAGRSLLITRTRLDRRQPLWLTRQRAKELLARVRRLPRFPIVAEAWRDCLEDRCDLQELDARLQELRQGQVSIDLLQTSHPSPFCGDLVFSRINRLMYLDDQPLPGGGSGLAAELLAGVLRAGAAQAPLPAAAVAAMEDRLRRRGAFAIEDGGDLLRHRARRLLVLLTEWDTAKALAGPVDERGLLRIRWQRGGPAVVVGQEDLPRLQAAAGRAVAECRTVGGAALSAARRRRLDELVAETAFGDEPLVAVLADLAAGWGPVTIDFLHELVPAPAVPFAEAVQILQDRFQLIAGVTVDDGRADLLCDASVYEGIRRLARRQGRRQQALTPAQVPALLARWQGLGACDELETAFDPLLGLALPAGLWERAVLPLRLPRFNKALLDGLVGAGPLAVFGAGERRVAFSFHAGVRLWAADDGGPPPPGFVDPLARYDLAALQAQSGLRSDAQLAALWEAFWQGRVTCDSWSELRRAISDNFKTPVLADRAGRSSFGSWQARRAPGASWALLPPATDSDDSIERYEADRERVRRLARRWGILLRPLLQTWESPLANWSALREALRLMELAGELVAAPVIDGLGGLQLADPAWLDWLATTERSPSGPWMVNAADPASGAGLGLPDWPARQPKSWLLWHGPRLLAIARRDGRELELRCDADDGDLPASLACLRLLVERAVDPLPRLCIQRIDGADARRHRLGRVMEELGAEGQPDAWVLRKRY